MPTPPSVPWGFHLNSRVSRKFRLRQSDLLPGHGERPAAAPDTNTSPPPSGGPKCLGGLTVLHLGAARVPGFVCLSIVQHSTSCMPHWEVFFLPTLLFG